MAEITQERIKKMFNYKDGMLFWRIRKQGVKIGNRAGTLNTLGYRIIGVNGKRYYEHRLIFLYHHGYLPKELDHINGDCSDNRIENLREVNRSQNNMNSNKRRNGTSSYKGVYYDTERKRWMASISIDGKTKFLGRYETEINAAIKYNEVASELFGEFANLNMLENDYTK